MSHRAFDGSSAPQTENGVNGQDTIIRAQTATGLGTSGGNLVLGSGDGYSQDGYVRIFSGLTEVARAIPNKFHLLAGQRYNTIDVDVSPCNVQDGYFVMLVNTASTAITVNLPAFPVGGDVYHVKDRTGNANTNNITISGSGRNIDGGATHTINTAFGKAFLIYNFTNNIWNLL